MGNFRDVAGLIEELTGNQDANEHDQVQPASTSYNKSGSMDSTLPSEGANAHDTMNTTPPSEGVNAAAPNTGKNPAITRC